MSAVYLELHALLRVCSANAMNSHGTELHPPRYPVNQSFKRQHLCLGGVQPFHICMGGVDCVA